MTAGDFRKERGRSPRKSNSGGGSSSHSQSSHGGRSQDQQRSVSPVSAASASSNGNGKKPIARITAGPKSLIQQQQQDDQHHHQPQQPQHHQHYQQQQQHAQYQPTNPPRAVLAQLVLALVTLEWRGHVSSPVANPRLLALASTIHLNPSFPLLHLSKASLRPSTSLMADRRTLPCAPIMEPKPTIRAATLLWLCSPARGGAGSGSPNSSGFLSTLMGRPLPHGPADDRQPRQQQHHQRGRDEDNVPRSCSPGGGGSNLAGKWFKASLADLREEMRRSQLLCCRSQHVPSARDAEDEAAYAQKLASLRQARHIV